MANCPQAAACNTVLKNQPSYTCHSYYIQTLYNILTLYRNYTESTFFFKECVPSRRPASRAQSTETPRCGSRFERHWFSHLAPAQNFLAPGSQNQRRCTGWDRPWPPVTNSQKSVVTDFIFMFLNTNMYILHISISGRDMCMSNTHFTHFFSTLSQGSTVVLLAPWDTDVEVLLLS